MIVSAFDSAGQRCSALRVLCLQDDVADRMLRDAARARWRELAIGDPRSLRDRRRPGHRRRGARSARRAHRRACAPRGMRVHRRRRCRRRCARGTFVAPTLIEIDRIAELEREVFGPVLHVAALPARARSPSSIDAHQRDRLRPDARHPHAHRRDHRRASSRRARAGNVYVNRNIVGAVVGVQPFGGEGLSGTGPKAGGPLYLYRLLAAAAGTIGTRPNSRSMATVTATVVRRFIAMRSPVPDAVSWRAGRVRGERGGTGHSHETRDLGATVDAVLVGR